MRRGANCTINTAAKLALLFAAKKLQNHPNARQEHLISLVCNQNHVPRFVGRNRKHKSKNETFRPPQNQPKPRRKIPDISLADSPAAKQMERSSPRPSLLCRAGGNTVILSPRPSARRAGRHATARDTLENSL